MILDLKGALIYPFTTGSHAAPRFPALSTLSELNYKFCHRIRGGRQGGDGCHTGVGKVKCRSRLGTDKHAHWQGLPAACRFLTGCSSLDSPSGPLPSLRLPSPQPHLPFQASLLLPTSSSAHSCAGEMRLPLLVWVFSEKYQVN